MEDKLKQTILEEFRLAIRIKFEERRLATSIKFEERRLTDELEYGKSVIARIEKREEIIKEVEEMRPEKEAARIRKRVFLEDLIACQQKDKEKYADQSKILGLEQEIKKLTENLEKLRRQRTSLEIQKPEEDMEPESDKDGPLKIAIHSDEIYQGKSSEKEELELQISENEEKSQYLTTRAQTSSLSKETMDNEVVLNVLVDGEKLCEHSNTSLSDYKEFIIEKIDEISNEKLNSFELPRVEKRYEKLSNVKLMNDELSSVDRNSIEHSSLNLNKRELLCANLDNVELANNGDASESKILRITEVNNTIYGNLTEIATSRGERGTHLQKDILTDDETTIVLSGVLKASRVLLKAGEFHGHMDTRRQQYLSTVETEFYDKGNFQRSLKKLSEVNDEEQLSKAYADIVRTTFDTCVLVPQAKRTDTWVFERGKELFYHDPEKKKSF